MNGWSLGIGTGLLVLNTIGLAIRLHDWPAAILIAGIAVGAAIVYDARS